MSNATTIPVEVWVNGILVTMLDAGAAANPVDAVLPALPWTLLVTTRGGFVLAAALIRDPNEAVRADRSCGRIDVWITIELGGPANGPGTPGDCGL